MDLRLICGRENHDDAVELKFNKIDSEVGLLPMECKDGSDLTHLYKTPLRPSELPEEAKRRLDTLVSGRKDLEDAFPQPKKFDYSFDLTRFLTEDAYQDDLSTKPQQEEAAFIIRCFRDPQCLQFQGQVLGNNCERICSLCGLTKEFHVTRFLDDRDGRHKKQNESLMPGEMAHLLMSATRNPLLSSFPVSETRDVAAGDSGDEADTARVYSYLMERASGGQGKKTPALTFGSVQIPMRFVDHPNNITKERYMRKYLKFDVHDAGTISTISRLWELLTRIWQLSEPAVVFSVTGGEITDDCLPAMQSVATAMGKITSQTDCWIISNSRNSGTSRYLGKMLHADDDQQTHSPVFIGATHWGSLKRRELLLGISLPSELKSSQYFYAMEYKLSQEENHDVLNPYQAVYLLLDNGASDAGDCSIRFRRRFEEFLKETAAKKIYNLGDVTLPVVTLVIGGDQHTLGQVLYSVEHKNPVILVNKSGTIPCILSELFYHLEDAYPRTWNETAEWKENERKAFEEYFSDKEENIRRTWSTEFAKDAKDSRQKSYQESRMSKIKKTIQGIMKNRYYVTVIDSSFESDETLHGSILQGIYKGYSRRSGMAIALKTGTYDFLQALFLRDVDPQFTKEHYITVRALNYFYQENLLSGSSISKALKLMCKRDASLDKLDPEVSVLPIVGRILQLLLGPRYKVMYQEEKYADVTVDATFEKKKQQLWHLFLWSVLSAKPEMTQFFLVHTSAPLGASLLAFKLYSQLAFYASEVYEEELKTKLDRAANRFQTLAIDILDRMYNTDTIEAYRVLVSELPFELGPYVTALVIADDANAMDFMSHSCCQTYLQKVWKGNMAVDTPSWRSNLFLTPFFALPGIHFDDSVRNCDNHRQDNLSVTSVVYKLRSYYTAPVTKFYTRMFSYLFFLGVLSYFVLTDLKPFSSFADISAAEWILIIWEISLIVEEIVQLGSVYDTGPLFNLDEVVLQKSVWHFHERLRMNLYIIEIYLRGGRWNSVDIAMVTLFIVSFSLRFSLPLETFQMARIVFAVTIIICYFRLLRFWYVLDEIGPRIIAIKMMLAELMKFLLVLAVFVISFGIAFQAILNPNQTPSWNTLADILWRPYWEMFGELFLDDEPGMGRSVGDSSCSMLASLHGNETEIQCYEWSGPVLLGVYLLISSVLLLNLLVAIFSQSYDEISAMAHKVWLFNLHSLIQEFYYNVWLPPPLSILVHLFNATFAIIRRLRTKKKGIVDKEDCFRQSQLPASHDLQKRATKEMKMTSIDA